MIRKVLIGVLACLAAASPALAQVRLHGEAGHADVAVVSWRDMPFRTVVRQARDYSCGSAALATLLSHHYGRPTGEAEVFAAMYAAGDQARIRRVGFSMLDMKRFLERRGYAADGYRMSLDDLARSGQPAIALINLGSYRHFVVVKGVRGDRVLVGDPASGLEVHSRAKFEKAWNGVVFAIRPRRGPPGGFNRAKEWALLAPTPLPDAEIAGSAALLTRDLPPLYQITGATPSATPF